MPPVLAVEELSLGGSLVFVDSPFRDKHEWGRNWQQYTLRSGPGSSRYAMRDARPKRSEFSGLPTREVITHLRGLAVFIVL